MFHRVIKKIKVARFLRTTVYIMYLCHCCKVQPGQVHFVRLSICHTVVYYAGAYIWPTILIV